MKKLIFAFTTSIAFAMIGSAHAELVTHDPVNGFETFQDTYTNLVWLKLPDLFGKTYDEQVATASAAGFTVADFTTVDALGQGSANVSGAGSWSNVAAIIGSSSSRQLMWGNYADPLGASPNSWYYAYQFQNSWNHYDPGVTSSYSDLGLWAYQTGESVPEPGSIALLGLGLFGFAASRRKSSKNKSA